VNHSNSYDRGELEDALAASASQTAIADTSTIPTSPTVNSSAMQPITLLLIATSLGLVLGLVGASLLAVYWQIRSDSAHHHSAETDAASRPDDSSPPERQRWQRQQQERSQND
jgi:hypothetical protein